MRPFATKAMVAFAVCVGGAIMFSGMAGAQDNKSQTVDNRTLNVNVAPSVMVKCVKTFFI